MFGVILWSNAAEHKAVIWCEDQGDLAFYHRDATGPDLALDAGDWVQFDLTTERNMRRALNPRLIAEGRGMDLANALGAVEPAKADNRPKVQDLQSAKVVPFAPIKGPDCNTARGDAAARRRA